MSPLGQVHFVFALVSLAAGAAVVLRRKGDRYHRTLGHVFFTSLVAVNVTSLFIYRLTGAFNFFHGGALASLFFVLTGAAAAISRRPRGGWLRRHAYFMTGSFVGLVAAAASETATRFLRLPFDLTVAAATLVVAGTGIYLMLARIPVALHPFERERDPGRG